MQGVKRRRRAAIILASIVFAFTIVQFCHSETTVFESKTCPVCQLNCASVGVAQVPSVIVHNFVIVETLVPIDVLLSVSPSTEARLSRAPPLS